MTLAFLMALFSIWTWGQGSEDFTDVTNASGTTSSYLSRTWTGNNGLQWTADDARIDQNITSSNPAICVRQTNGKITGLLTPVQQSNGIGSLTFKAKNTATSSDNTKSTTYVIKCGNITKTVTVPAMGTNTVNVLVSDINATGTNAASIEITMTGTAGVRVTIDDLSWTGYASTIPNFEISPSTTNLGNSCVGTSTSSIQYTITNNGTAASGIQVVSSGTNASDFIVSGLSSTTLAAGGTATFNVTFTPSAVGTRNATVTVSSTTTGSNSPTLSLSGTGNATIMGVVSTSVESNVGNTSVRLNGNLTVLGACPATIEKGFVWGINTNPTIVDNSAVVTGIATGTYNYNLATGLTPNTIYHYRAYIKDAANNYIYGADEAFTTLATADHIAFVGVSSNGSVNSSLSSFTVEARRPDNTIDASYIGDVVVSKASGSGNISGTLTKAFVNGIATFNDIKFDAVDTYVIHADQGSFAQISSGNIIISLVPLVLAGWDFTGVSGDTTTAIATTYNINLNETVDNKNITRGAGAAGSSGGNSFRTTGFQNNGIAVTNTDYFQNILKVKPGYKLSLSKINARFVGTNTYYANPGVSSQYAYSLDGTNFTLIGTPFNVISINSVYTVDLSAIPALQNIEANTTVYFRYYASGQTSTGGWGYSSNASGVNGLEFTGNITENAAVWQNGAWSVVPSSTINAVIDDNYSGASFAAAGLTINAGKTLTITSGNTITVTNVTNNGNIIVEDGGNFIQSTGGMYANTGNFTVNKNTTSAINKYVFWASPTISQNMYGIHTSTPQYVMTYDSATDYYTTLSNPATSIPGVGYSVKMPAANAAANFGGASAQPNNGNVVVTLNNTSTNKYNLIGNPYPSNIDLNAFYNANSSSVGSTFWFWDNTSNSVTTQSGNTTTNVGYATYNAAGSGTWIEAPTSLASHSGNSATIGQGFIVEATGTAATFTNAMRISTIGNTFNKLNGNDTGKFWLKLATPYGSYTTLAVNYEAGAQNTFDTFDSRAMGTGSDAFYSTVGAEKLVIQGKSPFTVDDVVPLGNKHFEADNFVISLTQKEGVFNNGQAIYLHDKDLGTYTNLQNGSYNFSANAGEFTNRFEIVYKLNVLGTQEIEKTVFEVYRDGEDFVAINSKNIEKLEVFDASGRKVMELKPNTDSVKFKLQTKGMYILRAISAGKEYTKKLVK